MICTVTRIGTPEVLTQNCFKTMVCVQVLSHHVFFLIFHVWELKSGINEKALCLWSTLGRIPFRK